MSRAAHLNWLASRWMKGIRSGHLGRGLVFKAAGLFSPAIAVDRGFGTYLVPTRDMVGLRTFMIGHYELDIMRNAIELLAGWIGHDPLKDRVLLEVGANIGTITIPALREFGTAHIVAIEPG